VLYPQQLRVLVAIRDGGSLSAAAQSMGYGVPTIAHHLSALENQVRAPLVERNRRGARLTPLGLSLVSEAEQILRRIEQAERMIVAERDAGLATLRIGAFASIGSRLLPSAIRELRDSAAVRVEVVEAEPTDVVGMLSAGELHAGIIYDVAEDPAFVSSDITATLLFEEPYQVLVGGGSSFADAAPLEVGELADADWICARNDGEASNRILRRVCHAAGFDPRLLMRTDDLNMIHGLVAEGLGVTLTTATAFDSRFDVRLRPTLADFGRRRTSFIHGTETPPPAVDLLHRILLDRVAMFRPATPSESRRA